MALESGKRCLHLRQKKRTFLQSPSESPSASEILGVFHSPAHPRKNGNISWCCFTHPANTAKSLLVIDFHHFHLHHLHRHILPNDTICSVDSDPDHAIKHIFIISPSHCFYPSRSGC